MFGDEAKKKVFTLVDISEDRIKQAFAEWVKEIGALARMTVTPIFIHLPGTRIVATCSMNTNNPAMRFNTVKIDDEFFKGRGAQQVRLIIHELGHAMLNGEMEHGQQWGNGCARVGAAMALSLKDLMEEQGVKRGI